ncbi:uncharacterized protein LOC122256125 [Penaeus japonicus]|uniref:uncharacterized protein LOC122256125 n=1 Tax=Penaeus japonicus TaxID=27405 RepID=UPI001C70F898|nr:uncharacterized protein LOC122256125 [Penaeus japonicus]XP_042876533.1 uncharacterized protein LOC122256125 [Penaeus japonicus]
MDLDPIENAGPGTDLTQPNDPAMRVETPSDKLAKLDSKMETSISTKSVEETLPIPEWTSIKSDKTVDKNIREISRRKHKEDQLKLAAFGPMDRFDQARPRKKAS